MIRAPPFFSVADGDCGPDTGKCEFRYVVYVGQNRQWAWQASSDKSVTEKVLHGELKREKLDREGTQAAVVGEEGLQL